MQNSSERREDPRIEDQYPVDLFIPHSRQTISGMITNWSSGGAYVVCNESLEVDTRVIAIFQIKNVADERLELKAKIVRDEASEQKGPGYGIMFTDLGSSGVMFLKDVLRKMLKQNTSA